MAAVKVNGKTVKAKKPKAVRSSYATDEKYTGPEPIWDTERAKQFSDSEFDSFLAKCFRFYNYYFNQKELKKFVIEWAKEQAAFKTNAKLLDKITDRSVPMTVCSLVMAHNKGMPFREKHYNYAIERLQQAILVSQRDPEEEDAAEAKPKAYVPTIQDRLNEKTSELIGEIEGHYDEIAANPKYSFKMYDFMVSNNVPQSQLAKYETTFQSRLDEIKEAQSKQDPQLVEAYSHYKAADIKRIVSFLETLLSDVGQYRGVKKATKKVRAPRAVSKEKMVSKLKYAKEDQAMKVVSINPADIVGAQELYVYNTKTRKLGKYIADSTFGQLSVKGTTIVGFDEAKSIAKTLRKPAEQLKEFNKAGKVQLRKFLESIKAVETKLNGRVNADTILLRVL
ncbi:MAG TPA: hypothetical protein VFM18_19245 [Methanosarcina sp.]|nr:hypothetical protein [Methanosarcina sp.]